MSSRMLIMLLAALVPFASPVPMKSKITLTKDAQTDLIQDLPGLPIGVNFNMFSGLVRVDGTKSLFYWFVESMKAPKTDPLVLWTNGGPGCSGLSGLLTEQGPFRPNKHGTLDLNPYAWNKVANIIFIEQPAGVGFSPVGANATYDDATSALDNYQFILGFLNRFPHLQSNDFYLSSESYGGHYLPTLATKIVAHGGLNFKGFAVGNPFTYLPYRDFGQYATFAGHQLLPKPLWDSYIRSGCAIIEDPLLPQSSTSEDEVRKATCEVITDEMDRLTEGLDPYGLDFPVCNSAVNGRRERHALLRKIHSMRGRGKGMDGKWSHHGSYFPPNYVACEDDLAASYLNRPEVQKAIHVGRPVVWGVCNDTINSIYSPTDVSAPMMSYYRELIANGGLRILIFSGDDDAVCATASLQLWIWSLGQAVEEPWRPWKTDGQTSGYTVGFAGNFRLATVHGAGHMVPSTRPAQALDLFTRFLSNNWEDAAPEEGLKEDTAAAAAA